MIGAGTPPKAGTNGNSSGVQACSGDGCCDTTIARTKDLISRVPNCTNESSEFQKLLFTFSKKDPWLFFYASIIRIWVSFIVYFRTVSS